MLNKFIQKFPSRVDEILCVYIILLDREKLKSRLSENLEFGDILKKSRLAPMEVIWHCESVSLSLRPSGAPPQGQARSETAWGTGREPETLSGEHLVPIKGDYTQLLWRDWPEGEAETEDRILSRTAWTGAKIPL